MKKLTRRQQEFLGKLLDLYQQEGEPIHYSTLAENLDVGKVTAYEMLRLLEERGFVQAEYQRPEDRSGPGRSTVVFRPTALAASTFSDLAGGDWDEEEWEQAKHRVLKQLRAGKVGGYEVLLNDLLARLPGQRSPIIYLAEMITATVLGLHSLDGQRVT
jgi:Mn-dependent DtxR family transcriptional regulator